MFTASHRRKGKYLHPHSDSGERGLAERNGGDEENLQKKRCHMSSGKTREVSRGQNWFRVGNWNQKARQCRGEHCMGSDIRILLRTQSAALAWSRSRLGRDFLYFDYLLLWLFFSDPRVFCLYFDSGKKKDKKTGIKAGRNFST